MAPTTSKMAILEIVYKAVKSAGDLRDMSTPEMVGVAEPLAEKIVEMVSMQGGKYEVPTYIAPDIEVFDFLNEILDEVEEHIPCVSGFNVTLTTSRFEEREGRGCDDNAVPA